MNKTPEIEALYLALQNFAKALKAKVDAETRGEPEDQLKPVVNELLTNYGKARGIDITLVGEHHIYSKVGIIDFALQVGKENIGFIELKATGKLHEIESETLFPQFSEPHDTNQWERFKALENLIYTDGQTWVHYRKGIGQGHPVIISGSILKKGKNAVEWADAEDLNTLFSNFLSWHPIVPDTPEELARYLAQYATALRNEVHLAVSKGHEGLINDKKLLSELLIRDLDDEKFADAYSQTTLFALLLAHSMGAEVDDLFQAYKHLETSYPLLYAVFKNLTDENSRKTILPTIETIQRIVQAVNPTMFKVKEKEKDPWLFFYENFLAAYDPQMRKDAGAYYTPLPVVSAQVRLIEDVLKKELNLSDGFSHRPSPKEPSIEILDPAVGTGTYLLAILDQVYSSITERDGSGGAVDAINRVAENLYGFELMVGPYTVAQLRLAQSIKAHGGTVPPRNKAGIYLANTLESPNAEMVKFPLFAQSELSKLSEEHKYAQDIKNKQPILVVIGNPPYDRHDKATEENHSITGAWVRWGDVKDDKDPILDDFLTPAKKSGYGVHLKNIYNLYVYFIRWALWKVFEHDEKSVSMKDKSKKTPGIVSFITANSYLGGDAFVGVREHMRRFCDEILIIDLGGEGRGTRKDENVFNIQTPVAIFVAWRKGKSNLQKPGRVRYTKVEGDREEKFDALNKINSIQSLKWKECPDDWQAPFMPELKGNFANWPLITDLMPWQHSGVELKRTWPISPNKKVLVNRWEVLLDSSDRDFAMKNTGDRHVNAEVVDLITGEKLLPVSKLDRKAKINRIIKYGYRSFDQQWLLADNRFISRPRPSLWAVQSKNQVYLTSLFNHPLGNGPALTICAEIPDRHHFRGSYGGKDVMPLYRDSDAKVPNILLGLIELLSNTYDQKIIPEDFISYIYAVIAQPHYTSKFRKELETREIRVPITKDVNLFRKAIEVGRQLIWLHTFGERFQGRQKNILDLISKTGIKCLQAVNEKPYPNNYGYDSKSNEIWIGAGNKIGRFGPASKEIWEFEVSGFKVVQNWLGYRMKDKKGKKSSPLDDIYPDIWTSEMSNEFLTLLRILQTTIDGYTAQAELLEKVLEGQLFLASELPVLPEQVRKGEIDFRKPPKSSNFDEDDKLIYIN